MPFEAIARDTWDRLYQQTPSATPFARHAFHRAWWEAYGKTAHEQYLVCVSVSSPAEPAADEIRAIVPLMHRHEQEPSDIQTSTYLRRPAAPGTAVRPDAKAVFFGASYHADYSTLLCAPDDLESACHAVADALAGPPDTDHGSQPWDVVDLRRLRADDPALPTLEGAFESAGQSWTIIREQEDVCPVISVADGLSWDDYLATLDKKARHEIRRKVRRAESAGPLTVSFPSPPGAIDAFIDLHQRRFGDDGLFPGTEGGARSCRFVRRLAELEASEPDGGQLQLALVHAGERLIFAALAFDDGRTCYLYNAGMDPEAADLSPGISGTAAYLRDRLAAGRTRFDFLRGNEQYKYEWGAVDERIERLLIVREAG